MLPEANELAAKYVTAYIRRMRGGLTLIGILLAVGTTVAIGSAVNLDASYEQALPLVLLMLATPFTVAVACFVLYRALVTRNLELHISNAAASLGASPAHVRALVFAR